MVGVLNDSNSNVLPFGRQAKLLTEQMLTFVSSFADNNIQWNLNWKLKYFSQQNELDFVVPQKSFDWTLSELSSAVQQTDGDNRYIHSMDQFITTAGVITKYGTFRSKGIQYCLINYDHAITYQQATNMYRLIMEWFHLKPISYAGCSRQ